METSNKNLVGTKGIADDEEYNFYAEVEDEGEDYILGTLMVRVFQQAKNLKVSW